MCFHANLYINFKPLASRLSFTYIELLPPVDCPKLLGLHTLGQLFVALSRELLLPLFMMRY